MAKIDDLVIDAVVEEEYVTNFDMALTVFENTTQIMDNMVENPRTLHLKGVITEDGYNKFEQLMQKVRAKQPVYYVGRGWINGYITNCNTQHHHKNSTGFDFDLTIVDYQPISSAKSKSNLGIVDLVEG
jgi:hypothetical protein